jgi:spore germination protein KB
MKIKISAYQMLTSIIVFEYGTAVLFFIIPEARRDAWLAILIYTIPAIILQIIYTSIWNKYPQDTIVTYMPKIFGKFIGYFLSTIYIAYFTYLAARVIRDFSELVLISVMPKMPLILISIILVLVISYGAFTGIENLSRFAQLFFPMLLLFIIMTWLFPYMTAGTFKLSNLMPVLENGIMPVIIRAGLF